MSVPQSIVMEKRSNLSSHKLHYLIEQALVLAMMKHSGNDERRRVLFLFWLGFLGATFGKYQESKTVSSWITSGGTWGTEMG